MITLGNFIFLLFLSGMLLVEGLGFLNGRNISLYIIYTLPAIILVFVFLGKQKFQLPKRLSILFIAFIALSIVSTILSVNIGQSITYLSFYAVVPFVFIYSVANRKWLEKPLLYLIIALSFIFCTYSILVGHNLLFTIPSNGYQFIFPKFASHNHLGDFLIIPLTALLYSLFLEKKIFKQVLILLGIAYFFLYFIFSYSRSAYISLVLVLIVMVLFLIQTHKKIKQVFLYSTVVCILLSLFFLFTVAPASNRNSLLQTFNNILVKNDKLSGFRNPSGSRLEYTREGLSSIFANPFLGLGPGNFAYASQKTFLPKRLWTESAHNILLDILVENGIPAGLVFIFLMFELFKRSQKNIYFYMGLAMLFNFQSDYTYRIYSFFILFFVLLGLSYEDKLKAKS